MHTKLICHIIHTHSNTFHPVAANSITERAIFHCTLSLSRVGFKWDICEEIFALPFNNVCCGSQQILLLLWVVTPAKCVILPLGFPAQTLTAQFHFSQDSNETDSTTENKPEGYFTDKRYFSLYSSCISFEVISQYLNVRNNFEHFHNEQLTFIDFSTSHEHCSVVVEASLEQLCPPD